jgi:uncharacterized MAPEG superfamily protein
MTIAYACMLIVILLPYVWVVLAKAKIEIDGEAKRYNNHAPRAQQDKLQGWQRRAVWAQNNAFEAMPGFLAAVLVAMHAGVPAETINAASALFVAVRVLHGVLYITDKPSARSGTWLIGIATVVYLFVQALAH